MRPFVVILLALSIGCRREVEQAKADPASTRPKAVASSPTSGPAPEALLPPRCVKGQNTKLTLSAAATEAVESITKAELDDALCPQLSGARSCLQKLVQADQDFEGTVEAKVTAGPEGELKVILDGGTLKDQGMRACLRDALLGAKLPHGPGEGRYSLRVRARPES